MARVSLEIRPGQSHREHPGMHCRFPTETHRQRRLTSWITVAGQSFPWKRRLNILTVSKYAIGAKTGPATPVVTGSFKITGASPHACIPSCLLSSPHLFNLFSFNLTVIPRKERYIMQSSLLLRARGLPAARTTVASALSRTKTASYATFKVPRIDNEPNVRTSVAAVNRLY